MLRRETCHHIFKGCPEHGGALLDKNKTKSILMRGAWPGQPHCGTPAQDELWGDRLRRPAAQGAFPGSVTAVCSG